MKRLAFAALILCAASPSSAAAGAGRVETGPLPVRDHFLLGAGFLAFDPTSAHVLETGRWRLDAVWTVSNTWAISPPIDIELRARPSRQPITLEQLEELARRSSDGGSIYVDGELSLLMVALRRGFGRLEVKVEVPLLSFGGGRLDGAIEGFHDAFGLGRDGRNGALHDQYLIFSNTKQGKLFEPRAPRSGIGNLVLGAKLRLTGNDGTPLRAAVETLVKLPTASDQPIATSGEIDYGVQLLVGRDWSRWSLHGSAGVVFLAPSDQLRIGSQEMLAAMAAVERTVGSRTSLVLQVAVSESPFSSFATSRIGLKATLATLGVKRSFGSKSSLFVAVTDNFQNFTNTADLSLHAGLSRSLR